MIWRAAGRQLSWSFVADPHGGPTPSRSPLKRTRTAEDSAALVSWIRPKPAFAGQALWQERGKTNVREQWVRSSTQIVSTSREFILNILRDTKVDE